jgi:uncharacterized protein (DUF58 family)
VTTSVRGREHGLTSTRPVTELTNARTRIVGSRDGFLADAIVVAVRVFRALRTRAASAWARLSAVVTGLGWGAVVLCAAAFVAGYALGWAEARMIAWVVLALLVMAACYLLGASAYRIGIDVPRNRAVAGETVPIQLTVTNAKRRRLAASRIEVPVGAGLAEFAVPSLAGRAVHDDVFMVPTARRGVIRIGPVRTVRADPVGLLRREANGASGTELIVHPRTVAIPSMSTGFVRDLEGNPTRDLTADDIAFHALREYAPGDERRNIHWKSTAKTGTFMVRQFEETRRSHLLVALSLSSADYADDAEFELAVSVAGSLGVRAIRDGRTVTVAVSATTPDFAKRAVYDVRTLGTVTPVRLLDDLARIEASATALRIGDVARVSAESAAGISIAFLVCGSAVTPAQLRHAATQFPLGVEVVAVICEPDAVPGLRQTAELSALTVGYLDDLQKSLARSRAA